jgi:hypothetical protein
VRGLAATVVPVAGLLAETAVTLEEDEFAWLRQLAVDPGASALLLSVGRFRDPERSPLAAEVRERLLARFGLFGLRLATASIASGAVQTSTALSKLLREHSGMSALSGDAP